MIKGMTKGASWTAFVLLALGCGGAPSIDRQVETRLTITSGVYGQTTSVDDVGPSSPEYFPMTLSVFNSQDQDIALASARSDEVGFYQIQLSPDNYTICTSFDRCTALLVLTGQCTRLDYEFSDRLGWSAPRSCTCGKGGPPPASGSEGSAGSSSSNGGSGDAGDAGDAGQRGS